MDVDVTGDVFVAEVRKREDLGSEVLAVFSQTPEPGDASRVTFGLDSSQVESAPPVAWYRIARLIGGDADAEQGIFEGRVRHE